LPWGSLLLVGLLLPGLAEAQLQLKPHPDSRFWVHGDATVREFTCVVDRIEGNARFPAKKDQVPTQASDERSEAVVQVPVRAFDCGKSRMTRDLQETLEMEQHPEIRFELVHATMGARTDTSAQWRRIDAVGPLTIAGTKRLIRLDAAVRALDDRHFRIRGCLPIEMTYFKIEPPSKLFGLIQVKDRIQVQYDLLAQTTSADSSAPFDKLSLTTPPSCDE
jgi:hypothetical protein